METSCRRQDASSLRVIGHKQGHNIDLERLMRVHPLMATSVFTRVSLTHVSPYTKYYLYYFLVCLLSQTLHTLYYTTFSCVPLHKIFSIMLLQKLFSIIPLYHMSHALHKLFCPFYFLMCLLTRSFMYTTFLACLPTQTLFYIILLSHCVPSHKPYTNSPLYTTLSCTT